MGRKWLSGRKRQTVNLLDILALVRTQLFSFILIKSNKKFLKLDKHNLLLEPKIKLNKYIKFIYIFIHIKYLLNSYFSDKINRNKIETNTYSLLLNFKSKRFFPELNLLKVIFNSSLGIISKFFSKRKNFLKSKNSYILSASYLQRVLVNLRINYLSLKITKLPKFIRDILKKLITAPNVIYRNPFAKKVVSDFTTGATSNSLEFKSVYFFNNCFTSTPKIK